MIYYKYLHMALNGQFSPIRSGHSHRFFHPGCIFVEKLDIWLRAQDTELSVSVTFIGFQTA